MRLALLALSVPLLVLTGCSGDDAGSTDDTGASSSAPQDTGTAPPSATVDPGTAATGTATTSSSPASRSSRAEARSVRADVETVAVSLESFYRGGAYPRDLAAVEATLADAGLRLSPGNRLGSYAYDADRIEFALCVEHTGGAWASYDTAPMTIQESGTTGGCP